MIQSVSVLPIHFLLLGGCTQQTKQPSTWSHGLCTGNTAPTAPTLPPVEANCENSRCVVEDGDFLMGSCSATTIEYPMRLVHIPTFTIDQYEVSIGQWNSCVGSGNCPEIPERCRMTARENDPDHPITCVNWEDAKQYCAWVGGRLPSEAEWEKAARGTDARIYPWGNQDPTCDLGSAMYYLDGVDIVERCQGEITHTHQYERGVSPYGVYNMAGNVWEWTADNFDARYYQRSTTENPTTPTDGCYLWQEGWKTDCIYTSIRGGSYNTYIDRTTTFARSFSRPDIQDHNLGFRCVYEPE